MKLPVVVYEKAGITHVIPFFVKSSRITIVSDYLQYLKKSKIAININKF